MEIIIIRKDDLDDKTIKVVDGKVAAPGAEIEVLDSYPKAEDTDTHYAVRSIKYLRHVETGALWEVYATEMKERPAPQQERFLDTPTAEFDPVSNNFIIKATSAIDGYKYNETVGTLNSADYTSAKDFNEKHAGQKLTFTTPERFSNSADRGKILPTTVEVDYPQLPYKEGTENAKINVFSGDPDLHLVYDDESIRNDAGGVTKTVHYKLYDYSGKVYEGTKTFIGNDVSGDTLAGDIDFVRTNIWKVEYTVEPFNITSFFGNVTVTPQPITKEIGDHL
jgi:hypothetical protein|nr:MAG TPA: hypothetical protein [Caudoviricetes sp.]